jgi:putative ABC transport system permease protein
VTEAGPRYFEVLGARVLAGRDFLASEYGGRPGVVLVNEPFVRKFFPARTPLGARIRIAEASMEIVGIVPDLGLNPGDLNHAEGIYIPQPRTTFYRLAARTAGDPRSLQPALHEAVLREAPTAQVQWSTTLADQIREVVALFRGLGAALIITGSIAFLLSTASLFAIVSFTVTQRTHEIGVRVALGASSLLILRSVLGRPARQLAVGAVLGTGIATGVQQLIKVIPFDIQPGGLWLTAAFISVMLLAGLSACIVPACRALRIAPIDALRHHM